MLTQIPAGHTTENADPQLSLPGMELLDRTAAALAVELQQDVAPAALSGIEKLSILMPVYNERWTVGDVLQRILRAKLPLPFEIIVVDDGSTDGSADHVAELATKYPQIQLIRQLENRGKGAAIRRGIEEMSGDVAVIQDADLEYDPADLPRLLLPVVEGRADAVFGSRFAGSTRQCSSYWHSQINRWLTFASNLLTDTNLTDMETGYKVVRGDILKQLRLRSHTFTLEPELACRLAQWGARIYEAPISYQGRSFEEGKKIRPRDGIKALLTMLRCRFFDTHFTTHTGLYVLRSMRRATRYNRFLLELAQPYLGDRLLEAGAGIGNLSSLLLNRQRLVLVDRDSEYVRRLSGRFAGRSNVRVEAADLTARNFVERFSDEHLSTIFCSNVLEHIAPDFLVLRNFFKVLESGGHCVIVVPSDMRLMGPLDVALGHYRRYEPGQMSQLMERAGFEVVMSKQFNRFGSVGWWINGSVLGRQQLTPAQMRLFDRLWPVVKHVDRFLPLPPMSQIIVGRKP